VALFRRTQPPSGTPVGEEVVTGYRDLRRIGRGGFSVVYRAQQHELDRVVALKVLSVEFIDGQVRRRFLREVKLTSRLTGHPNVVTVLDSGLTSAGRPYIAMEFFERGSLRDRLAAEGPLPVADVLRVGVKVAGALAAAHNEGILHRDVKPQNILVSRYGEPALADFGTARLTDAMDSSIRNEALTPYHAAPEILRGEPATAASDVYSLGSSLYMLLAGRPPYQSEDGGVAALLLKVLREDPPPIARPDVAPQVTAVIRQAMSRDPHARYLDALGFAHALQRIQLALGLPMTELSDAPSLPSDQRPAPAPAVVAEASPVPAETASPAPVRPIPIELPDSPLAPVPPGLIPVPSGHETGTAEYTPGDRTTQDQGTAPPGLPVPLPPATVARRRRWLLPAGIAVVVLLAIAAPLAFAHPSGGPVVSAPSAAAPTSSAGPIGATALTQSDVDRLKPSDLTVAVDGGTSVVLRWTLAPGTESDNLLVRVDPQDPGAQPIVAPPGATTYSVTGLNPANGYCFRVGPILMVAGAGQTGTLALAGPVCIRGAVASSP
jgi:serine/threonine protein kinase